jgi:hypothetical protein
MRLGQRALAGTAILAIAVATLSASEAARRPKKQDEAAPAAASSDKRDRAVTAPGTPFHNRAYWQAAAQCGGIYFKLNTLYSEAAITAKVVKPDPAAYTRLSKEADAASTKATTFFDVSERFLAADRKLAREEAVVTYDAAANSAGDRLKSVDAALQAAKPCPELYKVCRGAFPQVCNDSGALIN